jgi:hypothetical protein
MAYFPDYFDIEEFDGKPLPMDVYNQSGAILAMKGSLLSKTKLKTVYFFPEEATDPGKIFLSPRINEKIGEETPAEGRLSPDYREESAETILERLERLSFDPLPKIKNNLKTNVHHLKKVYEKKIVENMVHLSSSDNMKISANIARYMDNILDTPVYASEYMDMIREIRNADNYISFSHASSVAFYVSSVIKKLKMLQEDYYFKLNLGKWLPVETSNNPRQGKTLSLSHQMLKYIDYQKSCIELKYPAQTREKLFENIHDLMHEYAKLESRRLYPSLGIQFGDENRLWIIIAALNIDIGKLCLPNHILNKPEKLEQNEWVQIKQHPILSVIKLKEVSRYPKRLLSYILGHHNFDNKKGYPIFDKMLPLETKIISVCDMYDAMTSPRHYGIRHSHEEALENIYELYDNGYIDLPLYLCARHTFEEYNHSFAKERASRLIVDENDISVK